MTFPRFSIASKLYAIFGLLATATLVLAAVGIVNSRQHAAMTEQFERAFLGSMSVERVNGLIYALVMDERGIYMSADTEAAKPYTDGLLKRSDSIAKVVNEWRTRVGPDDAAKFSEFAERVDKFQTFQKELVRLAVDVGPEAVRIVGDNPDNQRIRVDLNKDIEALAQLYASRSRKLYGQVEDSIANTSLWMTVLGVFAVTLAGLGAFMIWRICIRPLNDITRVTEAVAQGRDAEIPHRGRNDEIGALAASIAVFQGAMRSNSELNETVTHDAQERAQRQEMVGQEIARFGSDIESSISELMTLSNEVHQNSQYIAEGVSTTSQLTARAAMASNEASSNVGDIASAAEELTASVQEIERQVSQSNDIAMKAVNEAAQTNITVQELNEAASRIGDVVKMINDIAAQTNLLALNATIEAARAGEAGRGFAVVAGEVKALAGQTAKATDEITSQIAAMQSATVRSIEAIGAIEHVIREIGDISGAIAAAVTEQGAATQEIARSVETASKRTSEAAEQVGGVSGVAETTSRHASEARLAADNLGSVAARIRGQVDDFFERLKAA